jgi:hypothetical protein
MIVLQVDYKIRLSNFRLMNKKKAEADTSAFLL